MGLGDGGGETILQVWKGGEGEARCWKGAREEPGVQRRPRRQGAQHNLVQSPRGPPHRLPPHMVGHSEKLDARLQGQL